MIEPLEVGEAALVGAILFAQVAAGSPGVAKKCPADPVPCDPSGAVVKVLTSSTSTGPADVMVLRDYAGAEEVLDLKVMRWPMWQLIRSDDA